MLNIVKALAVSVCVSMPHNTDGVVHGTMVPVCVFKRDNNRVEFRSQWFDFEEEEVDNL